MKIYSYIKKEWSVRDHMNTITLLNYGSRLRVVRVLLAMSVACCFLAAFRVYWTQNYSYSWLVWNLFLAWVPLLIAYYLQKYYVRFPKRYTVLCLSCFVWLLFFPNSPYIITDLIHLDARHNVPMWYDAILIFAFALTGLITGFISLYFIHEIMNCFFRDIINWALITFIFLLSGYGIYLGRVLRWNSWDLFTRPKPLLMDVTGQVINPQALFMTFVFTFFMFFSYLILHSIIHLKHQAQNNDQRNQMP
jgi:uncharacterized membrane protein